MSEKTERIAELNDKLRTTFNPAAGMVMVTRGFQTLPPDDQIEILNLIKKFNDFSKGNNPYGEHDFGAIEKNGNRVFWKIDYYNESMTKGSEDPSDPEKTRRVMTIMLAQEY
ncbi:MAG: DUF3768 domain-containing protein [Bacteroidota bacterium]